MKSAEIFREVLEIVIAPSGDKLSKYPPKLARLLIQICLVVISALNTGYVKVYGTKKIKKADAKFDEAGGLIEPEKFETVPDPDNWYTVPLSDFKVPVGTVEILKAMRVAFNSDMARKESWMLTPTTDTRSAMERMLNPDGGQFHMAIDPLKYNAEWERANYRGWHFELVNLPDVREIYTTLDEWESLSCGNGKAISVHQTGLPNRLSEFWNHDASGLKSLGLLETEMDPERELIVWMWEALKPSFVNSQNRQNVTGTTST